MEKGEKKREGEDEIGLPARENREREKEREKERKRMSSGSVLTSSKFAKMI